MDGAGLIRPIEFVMGVNVTSDDRVRNIRANAGRDLPSVGFKRVCICASGPSLADHVESIRARQEAGWHVATMNGSHNFLIEHGIVPDLFFMVDARPINLPFLRLANDHTTYIIASQCQPEIFAALTGRKVLLWQMFHDAAGVDAIHEALGERRASCFVGGMNVGHSCLPVIWAIGYKDWALFGYDGSMRGADKHAFPQAQNDGEAVEEFFWPMDAAGAEIPGVTKHYLATPTMAHSAQCFPDQVTKFRKLGVTIELFGEGLIPDMVAALAGTDGAVTATRLHDMKPIAPAPRPRKCAVERLPVVTFKWAGHIPYGACDVNVWGAQVDRWLDRTSELICVTDDPEGIDGSIRTVPMWRDHFESGRDWHRLKLFTEEMADMIGPRFVVMDLDTVMCGPLDPLFDNDHPFMAWRDPSRDQYCTALFMMDAGAFPHVWDSFDPDAALRLRQSGLYGGYDQAWISWVLPGQPRWTRDDGVLSFRVDILKGRGLNFGLHDRLERGIGELPSGARIINFHGRYNPRDPEVQQACPWIAEHWQ